MDNEKDDLIEEGKQWLPVAFHCFVDEVELPKTDTTNLSFYYFALLIPAEKSDLLEDSIKSIVAILEGKKFHAHRTYKKSEHKEICHKLNELIINHNLEIICFPFVKDWLANSSLGVLRNFHLEKMEKVRFSNYRSQAWLLFVHVLNSFLTSRDGPDKTRIFFDHDWLNSSEMVVHEGNKLAALAEIISTTAKRNPLLVLADHVGYMFQLFQKASTISNGQIVITQLKKDDELTKAAIGLFVNSSSKKFFHTLDLWEWIDKENAMTFSDSK